MCAHTQHEGDEVAPPITFCFADGSGDEGVEEEAGMTVQFFPKWEVADVMTALVSFFPISPQLYFFPT